MLVALPVHAGDLALAIRNIEHCKAIDNSPCGFPFLIAHERGFESEVQRLFDVLASYALSVHTFSYDPWKGDARWPYPQNWAFQNTARWIEQQRKWPYFFWWEADMTPLQCNALRVVQGALAVGKKPFCGAVTHNNGLKYMAGVGVYPCDVSRYIPTAMIVRSHAWDIVASTQDRLLSNCHDISSLICHDPGDSVHFSCKADAERIIPPSAVFFHKCKDGSLLDVLQGKEPTTAPTPGTSSIPSFTEQTPWECGYFAFPSAPSTAYFNCGVTEGANGLLLFTRRWRYNLKDPHWRNSDNVSDLAIWRVRENMTLHSHPIIPSIPLRNEGEQWEDPRVITNDGHHYVSFCTWVHRQKWPCRQTMLALTPDLRRGDIIGEAPYGGNSKIAGQGSPEKNWIWFFHDGYWHCRYSINPSIVFRVAEQGKITDWKEPELPLRWEHGTPLRGGTPPVRIGDEYIAFFHSCLPWRKPKRRYFMGSYAWKAKPPFSLTRMTRQPILSGSEHDFMALPGALPCVFPNGALFDGQRWLVTFGVNDEACGWIKIPHSELNGLLQPV